MLETISSNQLIKGGMRLFSISFIYVQRIPLDRIYIIQIWTRDEGNMECYGSEATILTKAKPRSILLLKIHKTHIARHYRSIFALLYVKCLWLKHIGLWIHILLDSP